MGAIALVVAGAVATAATVVVVAGSDVLSHPHANAAARGLAISLCVGVGAYTWWRRPDSVLGALVAGIGLSFALTSPMAFRGSLPFTMGRIALAVFVLFTVYVFACFPRDHLGSAVERVFMRVLADALGPNVQTAGALSSNGRSQHIQASATAQRTTEPESRGAQHD